MYYNVQLNECSLRASLCLRWSTEREAYPHGWRPQQLLGFGINSAPFKEAVFHLKQIRWQRILIHDRHSHHNAIGRPVRKACHDIMFVTLPHLLVDETECCASHTSRRDPPTDHQPPSRRRRILPASEEADILDNFFPGKRMSKLKIPVVRITKNY